MNKHVAKEKVGAIDPHLQAIMTPLTPRRRGTTCMNTGIASYNIVLYMPNKHILFMFKCQDIFSCLGFYYKTGIFSHESVPLLLSDY